MIADVKALRDSLDQERQALESKKADLENQKASLQTLQADQRAQLDKITAKQNEAVAYVNSLDDQVKQLIAQHDAELLEAQQAAALAAAQQSSNENSYSGGGSSGGGSSYGGGSYSGGSSSGGSGSAAAVVSAANYTVQVCVRHGFPTSSRMPVSGISMETHAICTIGGATHPIRAPFKRA